MEGVGGGDQDEKLALLEVEMFRDLVDFLVLE